MQYDEEGGRSGGTIEERWVASLFSGSVQRHLAHCFNSSNCTQISAARSRNLSYEGNAIQRPHHKTSSEAGPWFGRLPERIGETAAIKPLPAKHTSNVDRQPNQQAKESVCEITADRKYGRCRWGTWWRGSKIRLVVIAKLLLLKVES